MRQETTTGMFGAGGGNRTLVASLEGWDSTIELHPHLGGKLTGREAERNHHRLRVTINGGWL
jgi:hypothetical protein